MGQKSDRLECLLELDPGCVDWCVTVPQRGRSSSDHIHTLSHTRTHSLSTRTLVAPNSIPLNPESRCSFKLKLLFSYCKRLFHFEFAAVVDDDVLERFISAIGLRALDLFHNILEDKGKCSKLAQSLK